MGLRAWKTERKGKFREYFVSGWRYADIAIWHVTVLLRQDDKRSVSYVVAAGEFHPNTAHPSEKIAVIELIAQWEDEGREANQADRGEMTIPSVLEDMSRSLPHYRDQLGLGRQNS